MVIHQITADVCVKMARKQWSDELSLEYYALYILFKTMQYISFYSSLKYFKNNKRKVIWTKTYCLLNSVCSCSIKSPLIKWGLNLIECEWVEQRLTLPSQEYISQNVMENKIICLSPIGNQLLFLCLIDMIQPFLLLWLTIQFLEAQPLNTWRCLPARLSACLPVCPPVSSVYSWNLYWGQGGARIHGTSVHLYNECVQVYWCKDV